MDEALYVKGVLDKAIRALSEMQSKEHLWAILYLIEALDYEDSNLVEFVRDAVIEHIADGGWRTSNPQQAERG